MDKITDQIQRLKKEKNAVILAHYYTPAEVQALADQVGDSYNLAKSATKTLADVVVFCGVGFMGESVKILNPEKTVLVPDLSADCAMAHMADVQQIKSLRDRYDDLAVVCYINSTAQLKCYSDVCVTSSNAVKIVRALPNKNIFFIPDENLGSFVAQQVPDKNIILNNGRCPVHAEVKLQQLQELIAAHPEAKVLAHPECRPQILALSDYIGSTTGIIDYAKKSDAGAFIVCTEEGVLYSMQSNNPEKAFYFVADGICCADMKLNTPEKILHVLQTGENEIFVDEEIRRKALRPLERMLELAE